MLGLRTARQQDNSYSIGVRDRMSEPSYKILPAAGAKFALMPPALSAFVRRRDPLRASDEPDHESVPRRYSKRVLYREAPTASG
jgi:hypothetical protein